MSWLRIDHLLDQAERKANARQPRRHKPFRNLPEGGYIQTKDKGGVMNCDHDLAERETECADGACPICLRARIKELEDDYRNRTGQYIRACNEITELKDRIAKLEKVAEAAVREVPTNAPATMRINRVVCKTRIACTAIWSNYAPPSPR